VSIVPEACGPFYLVVAGLFLSCRVPQLVEEVLIVFEGTAEGAAAC
jgi:hypothetical protein